MQKEEMTRYYNNMMATSRHHEYIEALSLGKANLIYTKQSIYRQKSCGFSHNRKAYKYTILDWNRVPTTRVANFQNG